MDVEKHDGYRNQYLITFDDEELERFESKAYDCGVDLIQWLADILVYRRP